LRPDDLLVAETEYVIHARGDPGGECVDCPWVSAATFWTGTTTDTTPPVFDGLAPLTVTPDTEPSYSNTCGLYVGNTYDLEWSLASDEGPTIYRVAFDGEPGIYILGRLGISVYDACSGAPYLIWADFAGGGPASVHAVDLAGNEDTNTVIRPFDAPCPERPPPPGSTPDGSTGSAGSDSAGGCNATSDGTSGALPFAIVLIAWGRRRRRSAGG
jgi:uncharacterized protein (TIGR03382 family)